MTDATPEPPPHEPKRRHGLIIVNTGDGKGKTTAALGLSQRPDLLLGVAAARDDKRRLDQLTESAKEAAAASAAAGVTTWCLSC